MWAQRVGLGASAGWVEKSHSQALTSTTAGHTPGRAAGSTMSSQGRPSAGNQVTRWPARQSRAVIRNAQPVGHTRTTLWSPIPLLAPRLRASNIPSQPVTDEGNPPPFHPDPVHLSCLGLPEQVCSQLVLRYAGVAVGGLWDPTPPRRCSAQCWWPRLVPSQWAHRAQAYPMWADPRAPRPGRALVPARLLSSRPRCHSGNTGPAVAVGSIGAVARRRRWPRGASPREDAQTGAYDPRCGGQREAAVPSPAAARRSRCCGVKGCAQS